MPPENTSSLSGTAFRPPERDPDTVIRDMLEDERRESELFARTLELARDRQCSLTELYGLPPDEEHLPENADTAVREEKMDRFGNPRWISLTLPERDEDKESAAPAGVLPSSGESAAPPMRQLRRLGSKSQQNQEEEGFSCSGQESPASRAARERALREYAGKGFLVPRKAQPMRRFFRMLLLTAILAMVYHLLARQGWVPPIF